MSFFLFYHLFQIFFYSPSQEAPGRRCENFPLSTLAGCFCVGALQEAIRERGIFGGSRHLLDVQGALCGGFASSYVTAQFMTIMASFSVIFVNSVSKYILFMQFQSILFQPPSKKICALIFCIIVKYLRV